MIELEEHNLNLIRRLERNNYKNYHIKEIDGSCYIRLWDLISCLEDTEDSRDYAEEKVVELTNKINEMPDVEVNSLQLSTVKALNELHVKYDELEEKYKDLKEENDILRREVYKVCNEDDLDRLIEEGIELWESTK